MTRERLRQLAERCRELGGLSQVSEIKEQLAAWEAEFEADAANTPAQHNHGNTLQALDTLSIERPRK